MRITKTRDELIREAADKLRIVGTGQPLDAEYSARLDLGVDTLFQQLAIDGIAGVSNDQEIPSEWFDSLAGLLANQCSYIGGAAFDPQVKQYYEMMLRRVTAQHPTYVTQEAEYF
jgi:hypothetical protein